MSKPVLRILICGGHIRVNQFRIKSIVDKLQECAIIQELIVGEVGNISTSKTTAAEIISNLVPGASVRKFPLPTIMDKARAARMRDFRMVEESGCNLILIFGDETYNIMNHAKQNNINYILANYAKSTFKINGVII